jgi:O-acetylserine/cysteine efflux transporter
MRLIHVLASLLVAFIWGTNFVAIKLCYESFTPFALLFIRFALSAFPAIFFIPKPKATWKEIFGIALFLWIGQFCFMFMALYVGASPGIASLLLQTQTIFTLILSIVYLNHKLLTGEVLGVSIAFLGILGIAYEQCQGGPLLGFTLVLPAALSCAFANIIFSKNKRQDDHPLGMVVWSSLIPIPVMLGLSLLFEGPTALPDGFKALTSHAVGGMLYMIYFATLVAASLWAFLLKKYPPSLVVPFSLLIPLFGMASSLIILNEEYSLFSLISSAFVMAGLITNQLARRWIPASPLRKLT